MFDSNKTRRSSPSFNSDAAPPSYFEAIGIQSNTALAHINYANTNGEITTNEIYLNVNNQIQGQLPQRIIIGMLMKITNTVDISQ